MPHLQVFKSKGRVGEWGAKREMREIQRDEETEGCEEGVIKTEIERKQEKEERNEKKNYGVFGTVEKKRDYSLQ